MDKSHVTMEQKSCPICREVKDTGAILIDRRMRETFERQTNTGIGICPDCQKYIDDGYIAFLAVDTACSAIVNDKLKPEDAHYLPEYIWLKRDVAKQMLKVDVDKYPFIYVEPEVIPKVKEIIECGRQET